jgi:hypothetical protein
MESDTHDALFDRAGADGLSVMKLRVRIKEKASARSNVVRAFPFFVVHCGHGAPPFINQKPDRVLRVTAASSYCNRN